MKLPQKRIAISSILATGCAGFIGGNFAREFTRRYPKTTVVGIDDFSSGRRDVARGLALGAFYEGSIIDDALVEKIFSAHKPEYVFHFAAIPRVSYSVEHPAQTTEVNVGGTVILLEAAHRHGAKRFIFSSSSSVYGGAKKLPTKESGNPPDPKSPYALQKYVGELFCRQFSALYGLDTVCLRYFNVFGPGQYGDSPYATVISAWLETLYAKTSTRPYLEGNGKQSRDFCYVESVTEANIAAMFAKRRFAGNAINIAHGKRTALLAIKKLIERNTDKTLDFERRTSRLGDVRHTHADISKARRFLGYKPAISLEDGLKKTIEWYKQRNVLE